MSATARPMVYCGRCGMVVRRERSETEQARLDRHRAVGACRPFTGRPKAKEVKLPTVNIKSSLAGGWDL